jgi:hypothetical protein
VSAKKPKKVDDFNPLLYELFDGYLPLDDYVSNDYEAFGGSPGTLGETIVELIHDLSETDQAEPADPLRHNAKVKHLLDYGTETIINGEPSQAFLEWVSYRIRGFLERECGSLDEAFGLLPLPRGKNNVAFDNQRRSIKAYVLFLHLETRVRLKPLTREALKNAERAAYIAYYGERPEDHAGGTANDNMEKVIKPKLKEARVFISVGSIAKT